MVKKKKLEVDAELAGDRHYEGGARQAPDAAAGEVVSEESRSPDEGPAGASAPEDPEAELVAAGEEVIGEILPDPAYVRRLEKRVEELERKLRQTYSAHRVREQELEKVKERLQRDREKRLFQEKMKLFTGLLEPLDNLERCRAALEASDDVEALLSGLALVQKLMTESLSARGLVRFSPEGEPFDPEEHDAISVVWVEEQGQHDRIKAVAQPGYRLDDQILRPARVVVAKLRR